VNWPGSPRRSPLYLDIHDSGGFHARLLWDTVGYPWVCLQSGLRLSAWLDANDPRAWEGA
jgi:hypothetical protein